MIEVDGTEGQIIAAALRLAAERPWANISLREIAEAAGVDLVTLRKSFSSKSSIIAAYARAIDDEVLSAPPKLETGQSPRDALFEVIMNRFDAMEPHRTALRSMTQNGLPDAALVKPFLASIEWMLHAAGISTDGLRGRARVAGLATLYSSVFLTWLNDSDPGYARTMATLDRRLRSGERAIGAFDQVASISGSLFKIVRGTAQKSNETSSGNGSSRQSGNPDPAAQ